MQPPASMLQMRVTVPVLQVCPHEAQIIVVGGSCCVAQRDRQMLMGQLRQCRGGSADGVRRCDVYVDRGTNRWQKRHYSLTNVGDMMFGCSYLGMYGVYH
jgi:hypothetical protein